MQNKYKKIIGELSDKELLINLFLTQLLIIAVSFILGWFLFDDIASFLDLFKWNDPKIGTVGITAGLLVVLIDLSLMKWLPDKYYDDGGLNEKLFKNRTVAEIFFIALTVAATEEILFRGVIQTHAGLVFTSILFALVHIRYLFNFFLFANVIILSFLIGLIYLLTGNLLVTIVMHFVIDFLLGLKMRSHRPQGGNTGESRTTD